MIQLKEGQIDLSALEMEDLIDVKILQRFLDDFAVGMNCAAIAVDRNGQEITRPSHYRDFCNKFIHQSREGDRRCAECHNGMGQQAIKQKKYYIGECHAGLIDFAAPVIVKGEHIGTLLGGQILMEPMKQAHAENLAKDLNLSPEELWKAAGNIDIVPKKAIDAAASVLNIVVNSLADEGYRRIETEILASNLVENFLQISKTIEEVATSTQKVSANQEQLSTNIQLVNKTSIEVGEILKSITKVSDRTKLIGINASIEAARLGNAGKGFTIVANEIRNLSEFTKDTAGKIDHLNSEISSAISETIHHADETLAITQKQHGSMGELIVKVQNLVEYAERLKELFHQK